MTGDNVQAISDFDNALLSLYKNFSIIQMRLGDNNGSTVRPTHNEMLYMYVISMTEKCTATDLVELFGVSKEAVSNTLGRMEDKGLIIRSIDQDDNRRRFLSVSEEWLNDNAHHFSILTGQMRSMIDKYGENAVASSMKLALEYTDSVIRAVSVKK